MAESESSVVESSGELSDGATTPVSTSRVGRFSPQSSPALFGHPVQQLTTPTPTRALTSSASSSVNKAQTSPLEFESRTNAEREQVAEVSESNVAHDTNNDNEKRYVPRHPLARSLTEFAPWAQTSAETLDDVKALVTASSERLHTQLMRVVKRVEALEEARIVGAGAGAGAGAGVGANASLAAAAAALVRRCDFVLAAVSRRILLERNRSNDPKRAALGSALICLVCELAWRVHVSTLKPMPNTLQRFARPVTRGLALARMCVWVAAGIMAAGSVKDACYMLVDRVFPPKYSDFPSPVNSDDDSISSVASTGKKLLK